MKDNAAIWWECAFNIVVTLALIALATSCNAQKLLWRIEIHGTDTVAVGPAGDIDSAFVRWSLRGKALRECKWDLKWKQDEVEGLYRERDKCEELRKQAEENMEKMRKTQDDLNNRANRWEKKAKRGWLFFGFGAATLYVVQQQMK